MTQRGAAARHSNIPSLSADHREQRVRDGHPPRCAPDPGLGPGDAHPVGGEQPSVTIGSAAQTARRRLHRNVQACVPRHTKPEVLKCADAGQPAANPHRTHTRVGCAGNRIPALAHPKYAVFSQGALDPAVVEADGKEIPAAQEVAALPYDPLDRLHAPTMDPRTPRHSLRSHFCAPQSPREEQPPKTQDNSLR